MVLSPSAVAEFGRRLGALGWVSDLLVAGSLATGDYIPGVSDLDLVALVDGPVDGSREAALVTVHRQLDEGAAAGLDLGCVYVDAAKLAEVRIEHPTWTHGRLVQRILSQITRAELVRHGYAVFGRAPQQTFPAVTDDDIRTASRAELTGYWAWAARRPWLWLDPIIADLGLTSMARGRHAVRTGALLTKSQAIEQADARLGSSINYALAGEVRTSPHRVCEQPSSPGSTLGEPSPVHEPTPQEPTPRYPQLTIKMTTDARHIGPVLI